jgi:hypothetical protein
MSSAEPNGTATPGAPPSSGIWQRIKNAIIRTDNEITFVKGLGVLSLVGTLIGAYFHNLSAYDDKAAQQAKDDMAAATQTLSEAFTALSGAVSLQRELLADYYAAKSLNVDKDDNAYLTANARAIYKDYTDSYTSLHQNYNLLARKAEIFLDWPSDLTHDAAENTTASVDPINMSTLGEFDFDCEANMPNFAGDKSRVRLTDKQTGEVVYFDWGSAKHHVLAIQYCFDVTHQRMVAALAWAAKNNVDQKEADYMATNSDLFNNTRPVDQALRLNAFVDLAMSEIERIRVKYRPNGLVCSTPGVSALVSFVSEHMTHQLGWCSQIRTK